MCPPDPQRAHHRQMHRFHLTSCLPPLRLFLDPCTAPVTSRLVTFSAPSGLLAQRSWLYPGFDSCLSMSSHSIVLWPLVRPYVRSSCGIARAAMVGGAGFVREVSHGTAIGCALVVTNYKCAERQPRLTTSCSTRQLAWLPGCVLQLSTGVRTGGHLHPGLAGERLPKQRPKPRLCSRRPRGRATSRALLARPRCEARALSLCDSHVTRRTRTIVIKARVSE